MQRLNVQEEKRGAITEPHHENALVALPQGREGGEAEAGADLIFSQNGLTTLPSTTWACIHSEDCAKQRAVHTRWKNTLYTHANGLFLCSQIKQRRICQKDTSGGKE